MQDNVSIFQASDPFELTRRWLAEAAEVEPNDPDAAAVATTDAWGMPNVRILLIKEVEENGFVFYTNYQSAKGVELEQSQKAAFVFHWKHLRRQIRVRGTIAHVSEEQSDAYYHSRPLGSRIGAWASQQSRPLKDRESLESEVARLSEQFGDSPPRPKYWGGYRLTPLEIEFWADGAFRLHDREKWFREKENAEWTVNRLFP